MCGFAFLPVALCFSGRRLNSSYLQSEYRSIHSKPGSVSTWVWPADVKLLKTNPLFIHSKANHSWGCCRLEISIIINSIFYSPLTPEMALVTFLIPSLSEWERNLMQTCASVFFFISSTIWTESLSLGLSGAFLFILPPLSAPDSIIAGAPSSSSSPSSSSTTRICALCLNSDLCPLLLRVLLGIEARSQSTR